MPQTIAWPTQPVQDQTGSPRPPYDGMPVTEADYWAYYYEWPDVSYEWNNGVLEEKGVSDWRTALVFMWFRKLLTHYLDSHPIATLVSVDMGFRLSLATKTVIRRPDTAVILHDNPHQFAGTDRSYPGCYDLCIEALSDSKPQYTHRDTVTKRQEYAQGQVSEYYIFGYRLADCRFYRMGPSGRYRLLQADPQGVIASAVLPGFRWRKRDLIQRPDFKTLLDDAVYSDFVLPELRQAREMVAQERQRADQERQRADQAQQQAERFAQQLRTLGIDPE